LISDVDVNMDPKLLLVKVATLLFKEGQLKDPTFHSAELTKQIVESIKIPEATLDLDRQRDTLLALRLTVNWMVETPPGEELDRTTVLQRIRVNTADDESLFYAFESGISETEENLEKIKKQVI